VYAATKQVFIKVHKTLKVWGTWDKDIIHKQLDWRYSVKHNSTRIELQTTLQEIKLIGKYVEVC
jgi:hypothetical protein